MRRFLLILLAAAFSLSLSVHAESLFQYRIHVYPTGKMRESLKKSRYWGVALSGGGALGFAHLGAMKALLEEGMVPDMVTGTSMGAIIGGFLAAGYDVDDVISLMENTDFFEMFLDLPQRSNVRMTRKDQYDLFMGSISFSSRGPVIPEGILPGYELQKLFLTRLSTVSAMDGLEDFNLLYYPFRAVSADLISGEGFVWDRGDLGLAVRSSMNIPGVFPPLKYRGKALVDGGIYHNLPLKELKDLGADTLIAFDFPPPEEDLSSALSSLKKMASNLVEAGEEKYRFLADLVVTFPVEEFNGGSFDKARELFRLGYDYTREHLLKIRRKVELGEVKYFIREVRRGDNVLTVGRFVSEEEIYRLCLSLLTPLTPWAFDVRLDDHVLFIENVEPLTSIRIGSPEKDISYMTESLDEVRFLLKEIKKIEQERGFYSVNIGGWTYEKGVLSLETTRMRITGVEAQGNHLTSDEKIRQIMGFEGEQWFDRDLLRSLDRLYATGKFAILLPYLEKRENGIVLKLLVKERENNIISLTGNYRSDKGFLTFLRYERNQILHWGDFAGAELSVSRDLLLRLFAGTSSFLKTPFVLSYEAGYREDSLYPEEEYTEFRKTGRVTLSSNGYRHQRTVGLAYRAYNAYPDGPERTQWLLEAGLRTDTLDDRNLPTNGLAFTGKYETSLNGLKYDRFSLRGEGYWKVSPLGSLFTSFFWGKISRSDSDRNLKVRFENLFDHDRDAMYNRIGHIAAGIKGPDRTPLAVPFAYAGWLSREGGPWEPYWGIGVEQKILLIKYARWEYLWNQENGKIEFSIGARIP